MFLAGFICYRVMEQLDDKSKTGYDEFNDSEIIREYMEQPQYTPIPDQDDPKQLPDALPALKGTIRLARI